MKSRALPFAGAVLLLIGILSWKLWPRDAYDPAHSLLSRSAPSTPSAPTAAATVRRDSEESVARAPGEAESQARHETAPAGDLAAYAKRPMSAVDHHVARAWGMTGERASLGVVGAAIVVEPGISKQALTQLCRDVIAYHRGARALGVRVFDSAAAAGSERAGERAALRDQHLVALISRDASLGVETCLVRGEAVTP